MGISFAPSMRHTAYSHGSRTSTSRIFSPASSRFFNSAAVISSSVMKESLNSRLAPLKSRRPLFKKRMHAFQAIPGSETFHLMRHFVLERALQRLFLLRKHYLLYCANGQWVPARNFLRQSPRFRLKLRRGNHSAH